MLSVDILRFVFSKLPLHDLRRLTPIRNLGLCKILNDTFWNNVFQAHFGPIVETWFTARERIYYAPSSEESPVSYRTLSAAFKGQLEDGIGICVAITWLHVVWQCYYKRMDKKIAIEYPIDRYHDLNVITRVYERESAFTAVELVKLINSFYNEFLTTEELAVQHDIDNPCADDWTIEDQPRRKDMCSGFRFEGWDMTMKVFQNVRTQGVARRLEFEEIPTISFVFGT